MPSYITKVEGNWKIVDYPEHPECVGYKVDIKGYGLNPNVFKLTIQGANYVDCILKYTAATNRWDISDFPSTEPNDSPEKMDTEHIFRKLISGLQKLEVQGERKLIIKTKDDEQVRLEHLP